GVALSRSSLGGLSLHLWAAGNVALLPYALEPGSKCGHREYFNQRAQMCCSMCPPGFHAQSFCTETSDTVCARCEDSTYTQLWNWVPECLSCGSRCSSDQVETQACTREQNRICSCKPGWYCTLQRQEGCRLCAPLRQCRPGFGVAKPGTATSDVVCAPCAPGTFSNTTSSTDPCRPHRTCSSVAVPGNASVDAVCTSVSPTLGMAPRPASTSQPGPTQSQRGEPTPGPSMAPSTSVLFPMVPSPPTEGLSTISEWCLPVFCHDLPGTVIKNCWVGVVGSAFYLQGEMVSWLPFLMNSLAGALGRSPHGFPFWG
uniref:Tumor necrosis factor receptor superfamily member 1B n=1 Tax=Ursus maritimus TaxID=29073 RepID=A0A452VAJ7_URSMA